jgi:phosphoribosylformylglycinamidine synthase
MSRVIVTVMPRAETLDPQGQAVAGALHQLGFDALADVRIGKRIELEIDGDDPVGQAHAMCDRLLVNRLIEDYEVETA